MPPSPSAPPSPPTDKDDDDNDSGSTKTPPPPSRRRSATDEDPAGACPPPKKRARARLTEEQKKHNHIESEQKRRGAIRIEFDTLADVVPGMAGQGRSEATVMHASVGHIRHLLVERFQLVKIAKQRGFDVSKWDFAGLDILVARARRPLNAVLQEQASQPSARRRAGRGRQPALPPALKSDADDPEATSTADIPVSEPFVEIGT